MPQIADKDWNQNWYLTMAMYVMIEKGLYRTPQQIGDGLQLSVYPIFQGKSPGYCTDKITSLYGLHYHMQCGISFLPSLSANLVSAKSPNTHA